MNDNEYWVGFWMMGFTALVTITLVVCLFSVISNPKEEPLEVKDMKVLLDAGYSKQVIGCDKPTYGFVKDTK